MDIQPVTPEPCCKNDRLFKIVVIFIGILIITGLFGNIYLLLRKSESAELSKVLPTPIKTQIIATPTFVAPTLSTDDATDWKTYISQIHNFSVKYPKDWFLKSDVLSCWDMGNSLDWDKVPEAPAKCDFVEYNKNDYSNVTNLNLLKDANPKISEVSVEYKEVGGPRVSGPHFLIEKDSNYQLILSCFLFDENFRNIIDQILSTLKFLN